MLSTDYRILFIQKLSNIYQVRKSEPWVVGQLNAQVEKHWIFACLVIPFICFFAYLIWKHGDHENHFLFLVKGEQGQHNFMDRNKSSQISGKEKTDIVGVCLIWCIKLWQWEANEAASVRGDQGSPVPHTAGSSCFQRTHSMAQLSRSARILPLDKHVWNTRKH